MPQTLISGSKGQDVILLQTKLNSHPPTTLPLLLVDGDFGSITLQRVEEFQQNNGLLVDGVVGPITWNKLLEEKPIKGYWNKTWFRSNPFPNDSTLGIAFSGWADPDKALSESAKIKEELVGDKYISLGGGESEFTDGKFDNSKIERIIAAIKNSKFSEYRGIAFDIEKCDPGLAQKFHEAFVTAKNNNLQVLVTVSHTAPYGAADAKDLMTAFFVDENIDYLSPQLYTKGEEKQNDFVTQIMDVKWTDYVGAKAAIVPSIVRANLYDDAQAYFLSLGINTKGFIQWAND